MSGVRLFSLAAVAAAALAAAGCGGGGGSSSNESPSKPAASSSTVSVKSTSLGRILVDGSGRTLYLFGKDTGPKSTCSGACSANWPPFTTRSKPQAGSGASSSAIKTTPRSDGKLQVIYNGHPLYYFSGDQSAGQMNGEGVNAFGAKWFVLSPAGDKVVKAGSSGGSSSSRGYGGY
jgi:predicted lipoprotein with Yx(FWY)xxD motif